MSEGDPIISEPAVPDTGNPPSGEPAAAIDAIFAAEAKLSPAAAEPATPDATPESSTALASSVPKSVLADRVAAAVDPVAAFRGTLDSTLAEVGLRLAVDSTEAATMVAASAAKIASIAHEPGLDLAVRAERDNLALRLGIRTTQAASVADAQVLGLIHAGIRLVSTARVT